MASSGTQVADEVDEEDDTELVESSGSDSDTDKVIDISDSDSSDVEVVGSCLAVPEAIQISDDE
eukprot:9438134-Karenia_brevis.AAC.1